MTGYRRKLIAAAIIGFVSMGAFAQKGKGGDKRPPKPDSRVVVERKGEKPPPNSNQGDKRGGRRQRPEDE
jgi:hypothetical protein